MELTPRQESVYRVICKYHREYGYSPSVREICQKLGLAGPAGVHRILGVLEEKGVIRSAAGKKRSWVPVGLAEGQGMPVAGTIAAGEPLDVWDNPDERIGVDPLFYGNEDCFALRVKGDSMAGAYILDGDLAVIRPQAVVDDGQIAAVLVEGILLEATLKRVRKTANTLDLHSANPAYKTMRFYGAKRKKVKIIGKYVGLIRKAL
ncbi:MAG: transcriptional repressor LexA [Desulfobacteraceae bacterium]|nr:transcriptional repressor LexA [Desulfobacteraceae bacterium]